MANGLFESNVSDDDKLVYVNGVLKGKLAENDRLVEQSVVNSKAQFANSPDLRAALMDAIIDAEEAHGAMSTEAINSERLREGLLDFLLGPGQLYETLRAKGQARASAR